MVDALSMMLGLFVSVFIQVTPLSETESRSWVFADDQARRIVLSWDARLQTLDLDYFEGEVSAYSTTIMVKNFPHKPGSFQPGTAKAFTPGATGSQPFVKISEKLFPEKRGTRFRWVFQNASDLLGIEFRLGAFIGFSYGAQGFEGTSDFFRQE